MAKLSSRWWSELDDFLWGDDDPGQRQRNFDELIAKIGKLTGEGITVNVDRPDGMGGVVRVYSTAKPDETEVVSEDLALGGTDEPIN